MSSNSLTVIVLATLTFVIVCPSSDTLTTTVYDRCLSCNGSSSAILMKQFQNSSLTECAANCEAAATSLGCQSIRFNNDTSHCQLWTGTDPEISDNYTVFVRT